MKPVRASLSNLSNHSWCGQTKQRIDRVKARSWAGTIVSRGAASLQRAAASLADTQDSLLAISVLNGTSTAYFYPGFVLVDDHQRSDFALIDMTELGIASIATSFTETEVPPRDSQMIGTTWAKANKNGSRDRRFARNRELPIMRYGCLNLSSVGGMNEAFMFTNAEASADFARAVDELKRILASGRSSRRLDERPQIDRGQ